MALQRPPLSAMVLTAAGVLPFLLAAMMSLTGREFVVGVAPFTFPADGRSLAIGYGIVILSFMSGALWGLAAQARTLRMPGLVLSVLPALYTYFLVLRARGAEQQGLMIGFGGLLALDAAFQLLGMAPRWWLTLRVPATIVVFICLALV